MKKIIAVLFVVGLIVGFYGQALSSNATKKLPYKIRQGLSYNSKVYYGCWTIDYSRNWKNPQVSYEVLSDDIGLTVRYDRPIFTTNVHQRRGRPDWYNISTCRFDFRVSNPNFSPIGKQCFLWFDFIPISNVRGFVGDPYKDLHLWRGNLSGTHAVWFESDRKNNIKFDVKVKAYVAIVDFVGDDINGRDRTRREPGGRRR